MSCIESPDGEAYAWIYEFFAYLPIAIAVWFRLLVLEKIPMLAGFSYHSTLIRPMGSGKQSQSLQRVGQLDGH